MAMNRYIRKGGKIAQPTVKRTSSFINVRDTEAVEFIILVLL